MTQTTAVYWRDPNRIPLGLRGVRLSKLVNFTGNNTTEIIPLFRVYGLCRVNVIYGVVTQTLGSNHTTAHFRSNDGTTVTSITAVAGTTLSTAVPGTLFQRRAVNTAAIVVTSASQCNIMDLGAATNKDIFTPFVAGQKSGGYTDIEYAYATTETPTTGQAMFYIGYTPLHVGAYIETL